MNPTWIVTANASRARIFAQSRPSEPLQEIDDLVNTAVRQRTAETEQDRLGATAGTKSIHNTGGAVPNKTYEPHQTPEEHEVELFARSVSACLLQGQQEGRYDRLVLFAGPQFLGLLRKLLDPHVKSAVSHESNKDYTLASPSELAKHVEALRAAD